MSSDFNKTSPNEADIDQLVRVVKDLEDAFRKCSQITDKLTEGTFKSLLKITTDHMKNEKEYLENLKNHDRRLEQQKIKTDDLNKILDKRFQNEKDMLTLRKEENQRSREFKHLQQTMYHQEIKQHILLRNTLKRSSDQLNFFTSALTKGVGIGTILSGIKGNLLSMVGSNKELQQLTKTEKILQDFKNQTTDPEQLKKIEAELKSIRQEIAEKENQINQSLTGKLLGTKGQAALLKMGEFASKHAGGILIGAVTAGLFINIFKKALDVSPVFQQVKKLLEFGIMLVLRPIGDFFGFLLRPIVIMLLRMFIIPFYKTMYPFFRDYGTKIGEGIAALIADNGWLAIIAGGISILVSIWASNKLFSSFAKMFNLENLFKTLFPPSADTTSSGSTTSNKGNKGNTSGGSSSNNKGTTSGGSTTSSTTSQTKTGIDDVKKQFIDFTDSIKNKLTQISNSFKKQGTAISKFFEGIKFNTLVDDIVFAIKSFIDKLIFDLKGILNVFSTEKNTGTNTKTTGTTSQTNKGTSTSSTQTSKGSSKQSTNAGKTLTTKDGKIQYKFDKNGLLDIKNPKYFNEKTGKFDLTEKPKIGGITSTSKTPEVGKSGIAGKIQPANIIKSALGNLAADGGQGLAMLVAEHLDLIPQMYDLKFQFWAKMRSAAEGREVTVDEAKKRHFGLPLDEPLPEGYANGGIISEPIMGVGKSGKRYSFGERGAERVIPINKQMNTSNVSTTPVVINITVNGGIYSERDLSEFQKRIMQAIEMSNTRRSRL